MAVVTDSAKCRFISSAISLFNDQHQGFALSEQQAAFTYLDMTSREQSAVESELVQLES